MKAMLGLFQEQTVKLLVTPEMKQSLYILQCSSQELAEHINEQVLQNPLINMPAGPFMSLAASSSGLARRTAAVSSPVDRMANPEQSLEQWLHEQLLLTSCTTPAIVRIAKFIIGNLDGNGYLDMSTDQIVRYNQAATDQVHQAIELVQSMEPPGIAARSLQECLLLQLERKGQKDSLAHRIVSDYLVDFAERRYEAMALALKVDPDRIYEAAEDIRSLNPKPGAAFQPMQHEMVVPDFMISKQNNEYVIDVNDSLLPRLSINSSYRNVGRYLDREAGQYIRTQWKEAVRLIESIEQRKITLYRVMEAIVHKQRAFLDHGDIGLQPLTRKEIAEQLGLHESTISRAAANKFVQTPRGTYALKAFFSSSVGTADGNSASSESIKQRIKLLIQKEEGGKPFSDQQLCEALKQEGIRISRRTVTKYREAAGIPTSAVRRRS